MGHVPIRPDYGHALEHILKFAHGTWQLKLIEIAQSCRVDPLSASNDLYRASSDGHHSGCTTELPANCESLTFECIHVKIRQISRTCPESAQTKGDSQSVFRGFTSQRVAGERVTWWIVCVCEGKIHDFIHLESMNLVKPNYTTKISRFFGPTRKYHRAWTDRFFSDILQDWIITISKYYLSEQVFTLTAHSPILFVS